MKPRFTLSSEIMSLILGNVKKGSLSQHRTESSFLQTQLIYCMKKEILKIQSVQLRMGRKNIMAAVDPGTTLMDKRAKRKVDANIVCFINKDLYIFNMHLTQFQACVFPFSRKYAV